MLFGEGSDVWDSNFSSAENTMLHSNFPFCRIGSCLVSCAGSGKWKGPLHATQEEYGGAIRLRREEIRKAEAQLELRLATVVRDNKTYS